MGIERPAAIWWWLIVPPMTLLGVLSASAAQAQAWRAWSGLPMDQLVYQWIFAGAMAAHVGEGAAAWWLAGRSAEAPRRLGWALQTLVLGYPSLRLLLQRLRAG